MPVSADPVEREVPAPSRLARSLSLVRDYLALTKPRVIELLLVATIPVMLLAHRGTIDLKLILATLFGGWLGAASANTLNCVVDADIDKVMDRTKSRPLVRGAMTTRAALVFGLCLGLASFLWLWRTTNLLAAALVVATIAFYVLVYSMYLKRRTSQNVVWGGAAGCMPALVGWATVTGSLDWPAWVVFMVIFFWTPPHTWSLAMKYRDDYSAAGVPMLPTVADDRLVGRRMVWYTWATVVTTLLLIPAAGRLYAGVAVVAGAWFLYEAHRLSSGLSSGRPVVPFRLFLQSNNYLAAVFVGLAVDSAMAGPTIASLLS